MCAFGHEEIGSEELGSRCKAANWSETYCLLTGRFATDMGLRATRSGSRTCGRGPLQPQGLECNFGGEQIGLRLQQRRVRLEPSLQRTCVGVGIGRRLSMRTSVGRPVPASSTASRITR